MKKVNPKKLLPAPVAKNQASFSQKFLVPASRIKTKDFAKVEDTVSTPQQKELKGQSLSLKRKFISLTKLFGEKTKLERNKDRRRRIELERERRQKREEEKESSNTKFNFGAKLPKLNLPRTGFLDTIKRFLLYGLLGFAIDKFGPLIPALLGMVTKLKPAFEFFKNVTVGIVGGVVNFIDASYKAYDFVKGKVEDIIGPDRTDDFNSFTDNLGKVLNGAIIAATAILGLGGPLGRLGIDKGKVGALLGAGAGIGFSRYTLRTVKDTAPAFQTRLSNMLLRGSLRLPAAKELRTRDLLKNPVFAVAARKPEEIAKTVVLGAEEVNALRRAGVGTLTRPEQNEINSIKQKIGKQLGLTDRQISNAFVFRDLTSSISTKRGVNVEKIFEKYDQPSLPGMGRRSKKKLSTDVPERPPRTKAEADAEFFKSLEKDPILRAGAEQQFAIDVKKQKDADLDRSLKNILDLSDEEFNRRIKDARGPEASRQLEFDLEKPKTPAGRRKNLLARLLGEPGEQKLLDTISKDPTPSRIPSKLKKVANPLRGISKGPLKNLLGPLVGGILDFFLSLLFGDPLGLAAAGAVGAGVGAALGGFIGGLLIPVVGGFIGATAGGIGGDILFRSIYESLFIKTKTDERLKKLAGNDDKSKTKPPAKPIMPTEEQKAYFGVDPVVTGRFGEKRGDRYHGGTDIAAPTGTPLVAVTNADIVDYGDLSRSDAKRGDPNGWGNFIVYKDANGYFHLYGHLNSIIKKSGRVKRGEKIATVGNTGRSSGPHLHWELGTGWNGSMIEGKSDPLSYYSVMAPFRLSGGKQKANLAPPNRNVASGLGDMTDYEQGGVGEIALLPIVEQVETMSQSPSGGGGVIVLNSNAPSRFAPALIG